ncbi:MAG: 50S ribosomal protein L6 [Pseudomonadales bacterium]|jgi:large subunit ribosomal protein L6|nr:50S ribosomal protein L6 [Pseudomonadales bacterium]MDP7597617.1 50S ribosomal protein L6 [Pseudomonadales bacterium]HJN51761.1 50S ribosomal protein L6 [Pseudomonadales bacterium]|tara:strand:- start:2232 stop:2765 length:534 start_codon:yes stop_codon:yes gene_type:complete
MSRVADSPVEVPQGVEVSLKEKELIVKGAKGSLTLQVNEAVEISQVDSQLCFSSDPNNRNGAALAGTFRSLANNMVKGVSDGFVKELQLVGVGYRAQAKGKELNLSLGFSHPVVYKVPDGIDIECPTQTQILVKGIDKQLVGQVSAEIRAFRSPEPYKGKGIRYLDEYVKRKEAKKK